jgi:hypothetical protein
MPAELLQWPPAQPNWCSETGETLKILAERSPSKLSIVLFGSGALDFTLPFSVKSVDTDIHPDIVYGKPGHMNTDRETLSHMVKDLEASLRQANQPGTGNHLPGKGNGNRIIRSEKIYHFID